MDLLSYFKDKNIMAVMDSDLDGIGSRVISEYYLSPISNTVYLNTAKRDMSEFQTVLAMGAEIIIFVDIAPTLELYQQLTEKMNKEVWIFDHHMSSRDILGDRKNYYFDIEKCGCKILYEELTKGKRKNRVIERFVELVNTYDLYNTDSVDFKEDKDLHNCMYGYVDWSKAKYQPDTEKYNDFIHNQLKKFNEFDSFRFTMYEIGKIERANKKEQTALNEARRSLRIRKDGEGNSYGYFECTSKLSITANRLLDELNDKVKYLIVYSTWDKNNKKVSLRCKDDFDIRFIAERHGGGGHKNSSGVEFDNKQMIESLKNGKIHLI